MGKKTGPISNYNSHLENASMTTSVLLSKHNIMTCVRIKIILTVRKTVIKIINFSFKKKKDN